MAIVNRLTRRWLAALVGLTFFVAYLSLLPQTPMGYGDSDELIGIGYNLGLPHPPGYPLLTLLVFTITHVLPFGTIAWRAHLLAATLNAFTLSLFFLTSTTLLGKSRYRWAALAGTVMLGFNYLFITYAAVLEVFALNNLLVMAALYLTLSKIDFRFWIIVGLMVFNHQTSWLILPGLWLIAQKPGYSKGLFIITALAIVHGGLIWGLGSHRTSWTWNVPLTLPGILSYSLRGIYSGIFIEQGSLLHGYVGSINLNQSFHNFTVYAGQTLPQHMGWLGVVLLLFGVWEMWQIVPRRRATGLLLTMILAGPAIASYLTVGNLQTQVLTERMYLMGYLLMSLAIPFGLVWVRSRNRTLAGMIVGVAVIGMVWSNYVPMTQRDTIFLSSRIKQALAATEKNCLIVCFSDLSCFGLKYAQTVNGMRTDVTVMPVTPQMDQTKWQYPDNPFRIVDTISRSLEAGRHVYLSELPTFYRNLMGMDGQVFYLKPWLLGYELVTKPDKIPVLPPKIVLKNWDPRDINAKLQLTILNIDYNQTPTPFQATPLQLAWWQVMKNPGNLAARFNWAVMMDQSGNQALAKREYRHILESEPANASAAAALIRLQQIPDIEIQSF